MTYRPSVGATTIGVSAARSDRYGLADGATCDDGDPATTDDVCAAGVCAGTASADEGVTAGFDPTCARCASGGVLCWGENDDGQLGEGTTTEHHTPVDGPADVVEIATGFAHTCARRASGAVLCWGSNDSGQLGDGTKTPNPVSSCWGGDLADETITAHVIPTPVVGLADAIEIVAGNDHTCARRASGAILCWGENFYGQLGDGTATHRLTPTARDMRFP